MIQLFTVQVHDQIHYYSITDLPQILVNFSWLLRLCHNTGWIGGLPRGPRPITSNLQIQPYSTVIDRKDGINTIDATSSHECHMRSHSHSTFSP